MRKSLFFALLLPFCLLCTAAEDDSKPAPGGMESVIREIVEIENLLAEKGIEVDSEALRSALIKGLIEVIDPGGAILTMMEVERIQEEEGGVFYGIGVRVQMKTGRPMVMGLTENSPSADSGLMEGDVIEMIGERSTEGLTLEETVDLLRGGKGEEITLGVRGGGESNELRTINIMRNIVRMPVTGMIEEWPQQIGYLKVNGLYEDSGERIAAQAGMWVDAKYIGIILDIRDSGGSSLDAAAIIAGLFAEPGDQLFSVVGGTAAEPEYYCAGAGRPLTLPVMVLVNGGTRGASETLAAVLHKRKGVVLIGSVTRGDDRIREPIILPNGQILYVATRHILPQERPSYGGCGVEPDISVPEPGMLPDLSSGEKNHAMDIIIGMSEIERDSRALRERIGGDAALCRATDLLLGIKALGMQVK